MKTCAFTICAKNYLGLALSLRKAFLNNSGTGSDFFIFIADENNDTIKLDDGFCYEARNVCGIEDSTWYSMAFQYNIVEFCTAIKPSCFLYLSHIGYVKILYFDPDIFIFNNVDFLYSLLDQYKIILTPHVINPQSIPDEVNTDSKHMVSGIFNLGFAAFRVEEQTIKILEWWHRKLLKNCIIEVAEGFFTDQKWTDFFPSMLHSSDLLISHHLGMNFAPWNYHERDVLMNSDRSFVIKRRYDEHQDPLVFFHCSGYDYTTLMCGYPETSRVSSEYRGQLLQLLNECGQMLQRSNFKQYLQLSYSYNSFNNGCVISYFMRRIYRRLIIENEQFGNPFDPDGKFYQMMKKQQLTTNKILKGEKNKSNDVNQFASEIKIFDRLFLILQIFLTPSKYALLCRFLNKYCRFDNQARLIDKKYHILTIK